MSFSSFLSQAKGQKTLILTHAGCDVDAMASATALSLALKKHLKPTIGIPEHVNLEAKQLAKTFSLPFQLNPDLKNFKALILVDLNSFDLLGRLQESVKEFKGVKFLLDHHTKSKDKITAPQDSFIDESAVSTTELVFRLMKKHRLKFTSKIYSLIACGIITDSASFLTATHSTFGIMAEAMRESRKTYAELIELFSVPRVSSEKIARLKAAKRARIYRLGEFIAATSEVGSFESQAATALIKTGADLVFVGNLEDDLMKISGRANNKFVKENNFDLAKNVFEKLQEFIPEGSGGGHSGAAAFTAKKPSQSLEKALKECINLTFKFLKEKKPETELKEFK